MTQLDFEATCWRCRAPLKCDSLVFIHRNCMIHTFSVLVNNILSESLSKRRLFNLDLNFLWLCPTMHHIIRYRITERGLCDCVIFPQNGTKCLTGLGLNEKILGLRCCAFVVGSGCGRKWSFVHVYWLHMD